MFILGLIGIALISFLIWISRTDAQLEKQKAEREKQQAEHDEWKLAWEERRNTYDSAKAAALAEMEGQWGECTKDIFIDYSNPFSLTDRVWAFETAKKIVIGGNTYNFEDIIGFTLLNNSKTLYTAYTTGKSKKNLGSIATRGIVGKLIAGDAGAAIGAMTAEEDYEYETEYDSEVENDYRIYVNVNSISDPTITLNIGSNEEDAYEVSNLLNVIIARNNFDK